MVYSVKTLLKEYLIRDYKEGVAMRISRGGMFQTEEMEDTKILK